MIPVESIDTRSYIATVFLVPCYKIKLLCNRHSAKSLNCIENIASRACQREKKKNATSKIRLNRRWKITNRKKKKINKHKDKQNNLPQ